ncbi:MAG: efflux RND transporter periplasmic adaptor subunit [Candidatus Sericytochromatia bacterium]|nr:efflux RND transporter periplasmic adaptor subunit [Candidatus Sericytochromatia bacterium]
MTPDRIESPLPPAPPKRQRTAWIAAGVVLAGALGWFFWPRQAQPLKVQAYTVTARDVAESLRIAGAIEPLSERPIIAEVAGFITRLYVQAGDHVKAGQTVASLSDPELMRQVTEARDSYVQVEKSDLVEARYKLQDARQIGVPHARNAVAQARLSLTEADGELAMKQMLFDAKAESRINLDSAKAKRDKSRLEVAKAEGDVRAAQLKIVQAENALKLAEAKVAAAGEKVRNLEAKVARLTVRAPQDGLVSRLKVLTGQSLTLGTVLYDLADDARQIVSVEVNELDAVKVRTGMPVLVTTTALPDVKLTGIISLITPIAEKTNRRNEYNSVVVKAVLTRPERRIKAGSTVRAEIILQEKKQVPALALEAVIAGEAGKKYTWRLDAGSHAKKVTIKTGIADPQFIEITAGLRVGDQVVASQGKPIEADKLLKIADPNESDTSSHASANPKRPKVRM